VVKELVHTHFPFELTQSANIKGTPTLQDLLTILDTRVPEQQTP
jgi:hypothetical protein